MMCLAVCYVSIDSIDSFDSWSPRNQAESKESKMWNRKKNVESNEKNLSSPLHSLRFEGFIHIQTQAGLRHGVDLRQEEEEAGAVQVLLRRCKLFSLSLYLSLSFSLLCVRSMQRPHQSAPQPMSTGELPCSALTNLRPATHVDR